MRNWAGPPSAAVTWSGCRSPGPTGTRPSSTARMSSTPGGPGRSTIWASPAGRTSARARSSRRRRLRPRSARFSTCCPGCGSTPAARPPRAGWCSASRLRCTSAGTAPPEPAWGGMLARQIPRTAQSPVPEGLEGLIGREKTHGADDRQTHAANDCHDQGVAVECGIEDHEAVNDLSIDLQPLIGDVACLQIVEDSHHLLRLRHEGVIRLPRLARHGGPLVVDALAGIVQDQFAGIAEALPDPCGVDARILQLDQGGFLGANGLGSPQLAEPGPAHRRVGRNRLTDHLLTVDYVT